MTCTPAKDTNLPPPRYRPAAKTIRRVRIRWLGACTRGESACITAAMNKAKPSCSCRAWGAQPLHLRQSCIHAVVHRALMLYVIRLSQGE